MEGFKVIGIEKNSYEKNGNTINNITLHMISEKEGVVGNVVSTCYISDLRNPRLYLKACDINIGDIIIPINGKFSVEQIVVISKAE